MYQCHICCHHCISPSLLYPGVFAAVSPTCAFHLKVNSQVSFPLMFLFYVKSRLGCFPVLLQLNTQLFRYFFKHAAAIAPYTWNVSFKKELVGVMVMFRTKLCHQWQLILSHKCCAWWLKTLLIIRVMNKYCDSNCLLWRVISHLQKCIALLAAEPSAVKNAWRHFLSLHKLI